MLLWEYWGISQSTSDFFPPKPCFLCDHMLSSSTISNTTPGIFTVIYRDHLLYFTLNSEIACYFFLFRAYGEFHAEALSTNRFPRVLAFSGGWNFRDESRFSSSLVASLEAAGCLWKETRGYKAVLPLRAGLHYGAGLYDAAFFYRAFLLVVTGFSRLTRVFCAIFL